MWVRASSISPTWVGHNATHGFQILRAVPPGNPRIILPLPVDSSNFVEIHKTFEMMSDAQRLEWDRMKQESMDAPEDYQYEECAVGFDWAKSLLEVIFICTLASSFLNIKKLNIRSRASGTHPRRLLCRGRLHHLYQSLFSK